MNPNKRKGSRFEQDVVDYLAANGFPYAERRVQGGSHDRGDISGVPSTVIEVKNCGRLELASWVAEAEREQANAKALVGVVCHKRRGHGVADAYVTMSLRAFVDLIR